MHILAIAILCAGWLIPRTAAGEVVQVSPEQAVVMALANNHLLKGAAQERVAAEAGVRAGRARYLPRLALEEGAAYTNSPTKGFMMKLDQQRFTMAGDLNHPAASGDFRTSLTLEQPLFDRRIADGLTLAGKEQERVDALLEQRREDVALQTVLAVLEVQKREVQLRHVTAARDDAREHQRLAQVRSAGGVGLRSDELRARTYLSEMEQQLITAGNDLEIARMRLARVMGYGVTDRVEVAGEFRLHTAVPPTPELVASGLAGRADLRSARHGVEEAAITLDAADHALWPTLHALAGYQMNSRDLPFGSDGDSWLVGATLRWELFDGGLRSSDRQRATAARSAAEAYLQEQRDETAVRIVESYLRREETGKRLEVARHALLEAEEGVRLVKKRYENSLSLLVELLDAQTSLNRARTDLATLEADYRGAWARLQHAAGRLLKEIAP